MGLDMYLKKKTYVQNWKHMNKKELHQITVKKDGVDVPHIKADRISYIIEEVAYWRKANHIHQWFVENVQDGEDDCEEYYVSEEKLKELIELCKTAVAVYEALKSKKGKPDLSEILPTQEGFFFGSTEYDDGYNNDNIDTIKMLEEVLSEKTEGWDVNYFYRSSW